VACSRQGPCCGCPERCGSSMERSYRN
jgi:hypothetical protein